MELLKEKLIEELNNEQIDGDLIAIFLESNIEVTEKEYVEVLKRLEEENGYKQYLTEDTTDLRAIQKKLQINASDNFLAENGFNLFNVDLETLNETYDFIVEIFTTELIQIVKAVIK